jgi:hypothetical protein
MQSQKLELKGKKLNSPIFIVGCGRSGTSLLTGILGNHRNIYRIKNETHFFRDLKPKIYTLCNYFERKQDFEKLVLSILTIFEKGFWNIYDDVRKERFSNNIVQLSNEIKSTNEFINIKNKTDAFNLCTNFLTIKENKKRWLEKSPGHIRTVSRILKEYPEAKIIAIYRDPRAVYCSWKYSDFFRNSAMNNIIVFTFIWKLAVKIGEHLLTTLSMQYHQLKYEDLISNPEDKIKEICDFINEPYEPEMLKNIKVFNSSFEADNQKSGICKDLTTTTKWKELLTKSEIIFIDLLTKNDRTRFAYGDSVYKLSVLSLFQFLLLILKAIFQLLFIIATKIVLKYRFYTEQLFYELMGA